MRYFLPFLLALVVLTGCKTEDYTKGQPSVCEIHHIPMVRTTVPIVYGLLRPTEKGEARCVASTNSFPNAESYVGGGCCVASWDAHRAVIYVCPDCKKAAQAWDLNYDKTH
jgi:hypothetical protein